MATRGTHRTDLSAREQRLLNGLSGRERPVTAQALYAELRGGVNAMGLSTVYRLLHRLTERGLLHEFVHQGETGYRACEPNRHEHQVCEVCGRVQEVPASRLAPLLAALGDGGFELTAFRLELMGTCGRCLGEGLR